MARERNRPFSFCDPDAADWQATNRHDWAELKYDGHLGKVELGGRHWYIMSSTDRIVQQGELTFDAKRTSLWAEHIRGTEWARKPERPSAAVGRRLTLRRARGVARRSRGATASEGGDHMGELILLFAAIFLGMTFSILVARWIGDGMRTGRRKD